VVLLTGKLALLEKFGLAKITLLQGWWSGTEAQIVLSLSVATSCHIDTGM